MSLGDFFLFEFVLRLFQFPDLEPDDDESSDEKVPRD